MSSPLFDPGLQPERTLLAWRRTLLSLGAAGLVGLRLLPVAFGLVAIVVPLVLIAAAVALHVVSERRFRATYAALTDARPVPAAGRLTLVLAVLVALCALIALVCVLSLAAQHASILPPVAGPAGDGGAEVGSPA